MKPNARSPMWLAVLVALLAAPWPARAQDRIEPARDVRVLELAERSGRVSRVVVEDLAPDELLGIQVALARAGHDPGSRSGILDESTRRALASFQAARGIQICGCVTYETIVALGIVPRVVGRIDGGTAAMGSTLVVDRREPILLIVPVHTIGQPGILLGPGVLIGHSPSVVVGHSPTVGGDRLLRNRFPTRTGPVPMRPQRLGDSRP